mmetsp:Transcript_18220/g.54730  ORF Transcript_18220/g.54730 Transcript_18220/m.54730 type:complete len:878 (-) Transcript_18220:1061-3694(-)
MIDDKLFLGEEDHSAWSQTEHYEEDVQQDDRLHNESSSDEDEASDEDTDEDTDDESYDESDDSDANLWSDGEDVSSDSSEQEEENSGLNFDETEITIDEPDSTPLHEEVCADEIDQQLWEEARIKREMAAAEAERLRAEAFLAAQTTESTASPSSSSSSSSIIIESQSQSKGSGCKTRRKRSTPQKQRDEDGAKQANTERFSSSKKKKKKVKLESPDDESSQHQPSEASSETSDDKSNVKHQKSKMKRKKKPSRSKRSKSKKKTAKKPIIEESVLESLQPNTPEQPDSETAAKPGIPPSPSEQIPSDSSNQAQPPHQQPLSSEDRSSDTATAPLFEERILAVPIAAETEFMVQESVLELECVLAERVLAADNTEPQACTVAALETEEADEAEARVYPPVGEEIQSDSVWKEPLESGLEGELEFEEVLVLSETDDREELAATDKEELATTTDKEELATTTDKKELVPTTDREELTTTTDKKELATTTDRKELAATTENEELPTTDKEELATNDAAETTSAVTLEEREHRVISSPPRTQQAVHSGSESDAASGSASDPAPPSGVPDASDNSDDQAATGRRSPLGEVTSSTPGVSLSLDKELEEQDVPCTEAEQLEETALSLSGAKVQSADIALSKAVHVAPCAHTSSGGDQKPTSPGEPSAASADVATRAQGALSCAGDVSPAPSESASASVPDESSATVDRTTVVLPPEKPSAASSPREEVPISSGDGTVSSRDQETPASFGAGSLPSGDSETPTSSCADRTTVSVDRESAAGPVQSAETASDANPGFSGAASVLSSEPDQQPQPEPQSTAADAKRAAELTTGRPLVPVLGLEGTRPAEAEEHGSEGATPKQSRSLSLSLGVIDAADDDDDDDDDDDE